MPVILITNNTLAGRAGTEMYVRDIAAALLQRGWQPVACSSVLGETAEALRRLSVPVVDDPRKLPAPPDVIHAHHHLDAMAAIAAWPGVPVIAFCHGWVPWEEMPFHHPQIVQYVAVDELCRERLVFEHRAPADRVELLLNFVDLRRFQPRAAAPPERPRRALVFSNNIHGSSPGMGAIVEACARHGINLEIVGMASGTTTAEPEAVLARTDLVFAKGRCALEALAVGCGVVVSDAVGLASLVTRDNFERFRRLNFGFRLMVTGRPNPTADEIAMEIGRWDAAEITAVSARVREECGIGPAVERLVSLYERAMSRPIATDEAALRAASTAMSGYLLSLGATFKGFAHKYAVLKNAHHHTDVLAAQKAAEDSAELASVRQTCASHEHSIAILRGECAAQDGQIAQLKAQEAARDEKLSALEAEAEARAATIAALQRRVKRFSGIRRFLPRWLAVQKTGL